MAVILERAEVVVDRRMPGSTAAPGSLRRVLGLSLLQTVRSLSALMARSTRAPVYDTTALREAIDCVAALLSALSAVHAAEIRRAAHS